MTGRGLLPEVMPGAEFPSPSRRALLIGIDRYPKLADRYQLGGCVNDVALLRRTLVEGYGFPPENVRTLLDAEATRTSILGGLDRLIAESWMGDVVVFHYSGHGSTVVDREADEPGGLVPTIVAHDSGRGDDPNRDVTDDEVRARLQALAAVASSVTIVFDSCHSGTNARDGFAGPTRWVEPDLRPVDQLPRASLPAGLEAIARDPSGRGRGGLSPMGGRSVLIAGCRDEESAFELPAPEGRDRHGALTFSLVRELEAAPAGATYRDIFERLAARVMAINPAQHPQLEGQADLELFGGIERVPSSFARVEEGVGGALTLSLGAVQGVTAGSIFGVYPDGTQTPGPPERLARVRVDRVGGASSTGTRLDGADSPPIPVGARAFLEERAFGDLRLAVEVVDLTGGSAAASANLRAVLQDRRAIRLVERGGDVRVYALPAGRVEARGGAMPGLAKLAGPTWAAVGPDGLAPLFPPGPMSEAATVARIVESLGAIASYRAAVAIDQPNPADPLRGKIRLAILRRDAAGGWAEATPGPDGILSFREGDPITFRFENRHAAPVYFALLDFGLTGRIARLYPFGESQLPAPPGVFDFASGSPESFELMFPGGFDAPEGFETLMLLASLRPIDFGSWEQPGSRGAAAAPSPAPLDLLMRGILQGRLDIARDARTRTMPAGDPWAIAPRSFVLRR